MSEKRPTTIIRVQKNKDNPFVMIDKRPSRNRALSWKAKGILYYLLGKPDNWEINETDLIKQSTDGRDSVRSGLDELQDAGHLVKIKTREKGKWARNIWTLYEVPIDENGNPIDPDMGVDEWYTPNRVGKSDTVKPNRVGKTDAEKPSTVNPTLKDNELKDLKDLNNRLIPGQKISQIGLPWENLSLKYNPANVDPEWASVQAFENFVEACKIDKAIPHAVFQSVINLLWIDNVVHDTAVIGAPDRKTEQQAISQVLPYLKNHYQAVDSINGIEIKLIKE